MKTRPAALAWFSAVSSASASRLKLARATTGVALALLAGASLAPAATTLWWDTNGATAGSGTTGGTWNASNINWSTNSAGTIAPQIWGAGSIAAFSAGTNATGTFTITVSGTESISGITYEEGTVTLTGGTLAMGSTNATFTTPNNTNNEQISSVITGSAGLTKAGGANGSWLNGLLTLNAANTYTGLTTINAGGIRVTNSSALGATGTGNDVTFSTTNANWATSLQLTDAVSLAKNVTITNGGQNYSAPGQLYGYSGSSTLTGTVTVAGTASNVGSGLASFGANTGATLTLTGDIQNLAGHSGSTTGDWVGKFGQGTVFLGASPADAPNTLKGTIRVIDGILAVRKDGGFGAPSTPGALNGTVLMNINPVAGYVNMPTVAFSGGVHYNSYKVITTSGTYGGLGFNKQYGVIDNLDSDNSFAGDFRISGAADGYQFRTGATNGIHSSFGVTAGSLTLSGKFYASIAAGTSPASPRVIEKIGTGTLYITGHNDGTDGAIAADSTNWDQIAFAGQFNINAGNMVLKSSSAADPSSGTLYGSTGSQAYDANAPIDFVVNSAGTLTFDNSVAANSARINPNAWIYHTGGELALVGNASTDTNQAVSKDLLQGDYSTITVSNPAGSTAHTTLSLNPDRSDPNRGTLFVRGIDNVNTIVNLAGVTTIGGSSTGGAPNTPIVPYLLGNTSATGSPTDFVTADSSGNLRVLNASEYASGITSGDTGSGGAEPSNVKLSGNASISAETAINSVLISGAGSNISIASGQKLDVVSGAIASLATGASTISGGTLVFGNHPVSSGSYRDSEGIISLVSGSNMTISSVIEGNQGLTKGGSGTLTLTGNNTYGNKTTINNGWLEVASDAALGTGDVHFNGGNLRFLSSTSASRSFHLNYLGQNSTVDLPAGVTVSVSGQFSGAGGLNKTGPGTLVLTNGNSFTGGLFASGGLIQGLNADFLGSNQNSCYIIFQGGTIQLTGQGDINQGLVLNPFAGSTLTLAAGQTYTASGVISGSGNLTINGGATFEPTGNNTYTGNLILDGGTTLQYDASQGQGNAPSTPGTGYWTFNNNSSLTVNGQSAGGFTTFGSNTGNYKGITISNGWNLNVNSNTATTPYTLNVAALITGTSDIKITTDAGSIAQFSAANTFTGNINVTDGSSFQVGNDNNLGTVPASPVANAITLGNNATFYGGGSVTTNVTRGVTLAGASANLGTVGNVSFTIAGPVIGSATVTKVGTGTLILSGVDTYTGDTTVSAGTLQIGSLTNGSITSANVTVNSGANLAVGHDDNVTFASNILGPGTFTKNGSGTTVLTGSNSYSGGTILNNGTLAAASDAAFGSGSITFNNAYLRNTDGTTSFNTESHNLVVNATGKALQGGLDVANSLTLAGSLTGSGALTKIGSGTLVTNNVSSFRGGFVVNAGTLQTTVANLGSVPVQDNANLQLDHNSGDTYTGILGGSGSLTKSSSGVLTIASPQAYTGPTVISNGTLRMGTSTNTGTVPSGPLVHYSFDSGLNSDGSVTTAGVLQGSAAVASGAGLHGSALQLSGGSDVLTIGPDKTTAVALTGAWTTSAWFNGVVQGANIWRTLFRGATPGDHEVILQSSANANNLLGSYAQNGQFKSSGFDIGGYANGWHQLTAVGSGVANAAGTTTYYLDGQLVGTAAYGMAVPTDVWSIGNIGTGIGTNQRFAKYIDEVYVYGSALDANAVQQLYLATAGTLSGTLASTSQVQVASGAAWDLNNIAQNVGSLAGAGNVTMGSASLSLGNDNSTATFTGSISGSGPLTKLGSGTQFLSGSNNWTGGTNVNGGVLVLPAEPATGTITLANGAVAFDNPNPQSGINKIASASTGTVALTPNNASSAVNVSALAGVSVGALGDVTYTGSLTPAGTAYNLGGGGGNLTYVPAITGANSLNVGGVNGGTVVLTGNNTFTGPTAVNSGKLLLGSSLTSSPTLAIANNATAGFLPGTSGNVLATSLTLTGNATLDLAGNKAVLTGITPAALTTALANGRNGGAWTGKSAATTGNILSSTAAADLSQITAIGWALASDIGATSFAGVSLTGSELLLKTTYYGDLNLDGKVNADDYALADRALAKGGLPGTARWIDGDVNYDGTVNSADFLLIDRSSILQGAPMTAGFLAEREAQFGSAYVQSLIASVPEPSALTLGTLAGLGFLARRRRNNPA